MAKAKKTTAERLTALEERQEVIIDGFQFIADNLRNVYGMQGVALVFDAVVEKLRP